MRKGVSAMSRSQVRLDAATMPVVSDVSNDNVSSFSAMTRRIGVVVFPEFQILDAAGPIAAFEIGARYVEGAYTIETIALDTGAVRSSSGVALAAKPADADERFDT